MRKNKFTKLIILILALALVIPSGFTAYSMIAKQIARPLAAQTDQPAAEQSTIQQPATTQQYSSEQLDSVEISPEIQEIIRQSDPSNFDKNINNYKSLLLKLDVHTTFRDEMERLLKTGHRLPDVLICYEFLNDSFGKMRELETLIAEKESGKSWEAVFKGYNSRNPEFVPSSFEQDYLQSLMNTPGITSDDIMLADRVAQKLSIPVSEVINKRIAGSTWKDINAEYGILNAQTEIPHVPVTPEQIDRYTEGGLDRQKVILAFVIAMKMEKNAQEVIDKIKAGQSREQIYAGYYSQKYD